METTKYQEFLCFCFGCANCGFYNGGHDPDTQDCPKTLEQSQKNYDELMRRREEKKNTTVV